ncbi:Kinesin-like protein kif22 [Lobulomyces angularis]|nr:Kinesin-like protein kif22 [Lobulomyces angularis]
MEEKESSLSAVKVFLRIKPTENLETENNDALSFTQQKCNLTLLNPRNLNETLTYSFDHIFSQSSTQSEIFDQVQPIVNSILQGFNATCFAYGQTGSGKTHTIMGTKNDPGIIFNTMSLLFEKKKLLDINISVSYLEIYNEKIFDLLVAERNNTGLDLRETFEKKIIVAGLTNVDVNNFKEFEKSHELAIQHRSTGSTMLNEFSSRSHFIVQIFTKTKGDDKILLGKLNIIDLAGSEDNKRTGNVGARMEESKNINKSLFVLGQVVESLNKNYKRIPYRDSKITRFLQDSLGGNAIGLMITCISPTFKNLQDTHQSLNFATKSKFIRNDIQSNEVVSETLKRNSYDNNKNTLQNRLEPSNLKENIPQKYKKSKMLNDEEDEEEKKFNKKLILHSQILKKKKLKISDNLDLANNYKYSENYVVSETIQEKFVENSSSSLHTEKYSIKIDKLLNLKKLEEMKEKLDKNLTAENTWASFLSPKTKQKCSEAFLNAANFHEKNGDYLWALTEYKIAKGGLVNEDKSLMNDLDTRIKTLTHINSAISKTNSSNFNSDHINNTLPESIKNQKYFFLPENNILEEKRLSFEEKNIKNNSNEESTLLEFNLTDKIEFIQNIDGNLKFKEIFLKIMNTYQKHNLKALKGVGETRAEKIILTRNTEGEKKMTEATVEIFQSIINGDAQNLKTLLEKNRDFDINSTTKEKRTALHFAASTGNINCISILLSHSMICIDSQDENGNTPLHLSVAGDDLNCIKLLIKSGADPFIANAHGNRPLEYTVSRKVQAFLTEVMVSMGSRTNGKIDYDEAIQLDHQLPDNIEFLKQYILELVVSQHLFNEKCKQTMGINDKDKSETFLGKLQYWQDENERQCDTIAFLKINIQKLESELLQQEGIYRQNMADVLKQHTSQLKAIYKRNEETEAAFMTFQRSHEEDLIELNQLRSHYSSTSQPHPINIEKEHQVLQDTINNQTKRINQLTTENSVLTEKLNLTEKLKEIAEKENLELREDRCSKWGRSPEEALKKVLSQRKLEKDVEDEKAGNVIFSYGENGKRIKAATTEKLADHLLDPVEYDSQYLATFMLSYKLFITSNKLLDKIIETINLSKYNNNGKKNSIPPSYSKVSQILIFWIENYWSDFQDDAILLSDLEKFIETIPSPQLTLKLKQALSDKKNSVEQLGEKTLSNAPKPILPKFLSKRYSSLEISQRTLATSIHQNNFSAILGTSMNNIPSLSGSNTSLTDNGKERPNSIWGLGFGKKLSENLWEETKYKFMDWEPLELARQITLIEFEFFYAIKPREFLDLAWMKPDKDLKSPNIMKMVKWSNHVVNWIISEIVSVKDSTKSRAIVFEKVVMIAYHLDKLKNYNGLKEFIAALQSSSVYRLKKTKESVSAKYLKIYDDLAKIISSELNYKNLRGKVMHSEPPLIPFPGVYQGDLVYLDTCNKNRLDGGLVNFYKLEKCSALILELQQFQKIPYKLIPVFEIQTYIKNFTVFDEDSAYNHSLLCEPRMSQ